MFLVCTRFSSHLQHIVVGTPGRLKKLVNDGILKLDSLKHFVLDECDQVLDAEGMLRFFNEVLQRFIAILPDFFPCLASTGAFYAATWVL